MSAAGPLQLFNTASRRKERFAPLDPAGPVNMYVCGVTVYDLSHIGAGVGGVGVSCVSWRRAGMLSRHRLL